MVFREPGALHSKRAPMNSSSFPAKRALAVALLVSTGCQHTTLVSVKDPALVSASVRDAKGDVVELHPGCKPCSVDATLPPPLYLLFGGDAQRVTLSRDASGALRFGAPDTPGNTEGTLVTDQGAVAVPPSYLGADDWWRTGADLNLRYLVTTEHGSYKRHIDPSFEIGMRTPLSNVAHAEIRTVPLRGFGVVFVAFGAVLTVASLASLTFKSADSRLAGAVAFGGFALTFTTAGVLLLALPETTHRLDLP